MQLIRILLAVAWCATLGPAQSKAQDAQGSTTQSQTATSFAGALKIVKLLWSANPGSAAKTLAKTITTAADRGELSQLQSAVSVLQNDLASVVSSADLSDPRYASALAAQLLNAQNRPTDATIASALNELPSLDQRLMLWQVWLAVAPLPALKHFQASLAGTAADADADAGADQTAKSTATATAEAWHSAMIVTALRSDRRRAADILIANWKHLSAAGQLAAIEPLTANADTMQLLLEGIAAGSISKDLVNTNQLRKWSNSSNSSLTAAIEALWGRVRPEDNAARAELVNKTLHRIQGGAQGSASRGAIIFDRVCSQCHVLHGRGYEVGPPIAANGRGNLQQLISNILDPSLVIGEAFQAKTVLTLDGQVISGLVTAENDRYLTLKVQGGKTIEFEKAELEEIQTSTHSLMPEGVESQMQPQELLDLLAYLCLLKPLEAADNQLIPGTPTDFVQP